MLKRFFACLMAVACLLTALAALADGDMKVVKVKRVVNMREEANTNCKIVAVVPLGTVLSGCQPVEDANWYAASYEGISGYIYGDYLEPVAVEPAAAEEAEPAAEPTAAEETEPAAEAAPVAETAQAAAPAEEPAAAPAPIAVEVPGEAAESELFIQTPPAGEVTDTSGYADDFVILDEAVGGIHVIGRQIFQADSEYIMVVGMDENWNTLWKHDSATGNITELTQTDCFIGGTEQDPLVMMYNAWSGLTAIDPASGEVRWTLRREDVSLGASISYAVGGDGVAYVGGYYGPDPVAIDAGGNVLWQADSGDAKAVWLYAVELQSDGIAARYYNLSGDRSGAIIYNYDGTVKEIVYD